MFLQLPFQCSEDEPNMSQREFSASLIVYEFHPVGDDVIQYDLSTKTLLIVLA